MSQIGQKANAACKDDRRLGGPVTLLDPQVSLRQIEIHKYRNTNTDAQTQIQMMGAWANWKLLGAFSLEDLHLPLWSFKSLAHFASFKLSKLFIFKQQLMVLGGGIVREEFYAI